MSPLPGRRPVVIGIDDRPTGVVALEWAIDEAARRGLPLHLLHAGQEEPPVMAEAVAHARALAPRLRVTSEVTDRVASVALLEASSRADCIVLGSHGRSTLLGAVLGTTAQEVTTRAACPVVVARQFPVIAQARPGVVVGADGSELSADAIGYAFAQADDRELPLTLVHACSSATSSAAPPSVVVAIEVAGWAERYPDVRVNRHVLRGSPIKALVDHSRGAELLVVGSRGLGGLSGMLLGSVSQGVLQHAHCPVAVVRPRTA